MCLVQMVLGTRDGVWATPFLISGCVCVDLHVNHAYTLVEILLYSKYYEGEVGVTERVVSV